MKTMCRELLNRLSSAIEVLSITQHESCICFKYRGNGKVKTAVFVKDQDLAKLMVEFDKADSHVDDKMYKYTYITNELDNGAFEMKPIKELVKYDDIRFTDDEAKEMCARYEYKEANKQAGDLFHQIAKVISIAPLKKGHAA